MRGPLDGSGAEGLTSRLANSRAGSSPKSRKNAVLLDTFLLLTFAREQTLAMQ
jgi:hypothetical protein